MIQHQHQKIIVPGPVGALQSLYQRGETGQAAVVVCHPHPQHGGTMRNKVVYWIARAFEDAGCSVLRFNFRGVEQSEGEWDDGHGEADDAAAALNWLHARHPDSPLWLAGFSFGCYAGLQAARNDARVSRLFAIAPAVNLWSFAFMQGDQRPLTVIAGNNDEIVPFALVQASVAGQSNIHFHAIEGAGHFFPNHKDEMITALSADIANPLT